MGAQVERVAVGGVDAAQQHIDTFVLAERPHVDRAVTHRQVGALDQRETQYGRQVRLVEEGLRHAAGAEHRDGRVVDPRRGVVGQRQSQSARERRHRAWCTALEQLRERTGDQSTVGDGEPDARRRLRPVGVDGEGAVGQASEVECVQEQRMRTRDLEPGGLAHVAGMSEDHLRRYQPCVDGLLVAVDVAQDEIEQHRPLGDRLLQLGPLDTVEDQRDSVEQPGSRNGRGAVDLVVDDAFIRYRRGKPRRRRPQSVVATQRVARDELVPRGTYRARGIEHFVVMVACGSRCGTARIELSEIEQRVTVGSVPVEHRGHTAAR